MALTLEDQSYTFSNGSVAVVCPAMLGAWLSNPSTLLQPGLISHFMGCHRRWWRSLGVGLTWLLRLLWQQLRGEEGRSVGLDERAALAQMLMHCCQRLSDVFQHPRRVVLSCPV